MKTKTIICACHSIEHQCTFYKDEDETAVMIHLINYKSFWQRLIYGVRYIFGYKCKYGDWDEFIFKPEDLVKLKEFLDEERND